MTTIDNLKTYTCIEIFFNLYNQKKIKEINFEVIRDLIVFQHELKIPNHMFKTIEITKDNHTVIIQEDKGFVCVLYKNKPFIICLTQDPSEEVIQNIREFDEWYNNQVKEAIESKKQKNEITDSK